MSAATMRRLIDFPRRQIRNAPARESALTSHSQLRDRNVLERDDPALLARAPKVFTFRRWHGGLFRPTTDLPPRLPEVTCARSIPLDPRSSPKCQMARCTLHLRRSFRPRVLASSLDLRLCEESVIRLDERRHLTSNSRF